MRAIGDVGVHGFAKQCSLHFVRSALNRSPMNTNALPLQECAMPPDRRC